MTRTLPIADVPVQLTEASAIYASRRFLGDETTAEIGDTLLTHTSKRRLAERHPEQFTRLAEAKSR
jgi:hypothetical protein